MKLIIYGADWCKPCHLAHQTALGLRGQHPALQVEYRDVEQQPLPGEYANITSVPVLFGVTSDGRLERIVPVTGEAMRRYLEDRERG